MSSSPSLRLGIIGLGNIGQQHLQNIIKGEVPGCHVSAVCSRHLTALPHTDATEHFNDYRSLIDSGCCDAILVATPTGSHAEIGAYALRAGLHVMMEKPLGLSLAEGEQLLALQQPEQTFALMLNQRAAPLFLTMRDHLQRGALGTITRSHWTMTNWFRPEIYYQVSDWRATWCGEGGGLLVNQCIHNLDIYQWLCGMPTRVRAFCRFGRYHNIEVEDEATAYFEYDNGASGGFIGSTGEAPGCNSFDIVGDKGSLKYNGDTLILYENEPTTSEYSRKSQELFGMPKVRQRDITPSEVVNQHALLLSNFVAAINTGADLIAPAAEGLKSLALANSMLLSTWEDRWVDMPLDSAAYQLQLQRRLDESKLREPKRMTAIVDMSKSFR